MAHYSIPNPAPLQSNQLQCEYNNQKLMIFEHFFQTVLHVKNFLFFYTSVYEQGLSLLGNEFCKGANIGPSLLDNAK